MKKEELLDKYIKYNSKITFDIFKLMYQKLIDLGFTSPHKVENAFKEFSGKYNYFVMTVMYDELYFNQFASVTKIQSEILVEDLLGYNPFESFKLPEKWCIKVTEDNQSILSKWRTDSTCFEGTYLLSPRHPLNPDSEIKIGYAVTNIPEDTVEITFTQFKQYVLKEPIVTKSPKSFPSRWCIELNETTIPIVGNYYNKKNLEDPNCDTYTASASNYSGYYVRSHNTADEYVKNGYHYCSFFNNPSDDYPEITLEDFKQFVMEESTSKPKIESKGDNPKYVKCCHCDTSDFIFNKIYKCHPGSTSDILILDSERGERSTLPYEGVLWGFELSTKEAFEMQNKSKSMEKWGKDSYVVCIKNYGSYFKVGDIGKIQNISRPTDCCINISQSVGKACLPFKSSCQWFATLTEAEEFAKTLIPPSKFKIGDSIQSNPGGYEYDENGLELPCAISYLKVNVVTTGKCTKITYSKQHRCYWYKIDDYANMFTEDCITLVKAKSDNPYILNTIYKIEENGKFCLCKYIGMRDSERMKGYTLSDMNGILEFENCAVYIPGRDVSLASKEECDWLELCIRNNKLMDRPSLIKTFPIEGHCEKNSDIIKYLSKSKTIYESSIDKENNNKFKFICWNEAYYWFTCDKSSKQYYSFISILELIQKEKQLKQAVHCTTQEEWDFVTEKLGYKWSKHSEWSVYKNNTCIGLQELGFGTAGVGYKGYQILSFQDWCNLNGYEMKKTRFKTGDYVVSLRPEYLSTIHIKSNYCYIQYKDEDRISIDSSTIMCEDNINYARLATPEEIEEYKRIGKPYDVTTLQPESINTYGLKVGDHLDESIICAWTSISNNRYQSGEANGNWRLNKSAFCGDRKIESFKVIKGVVGFLVSGTIQVYLRAEGFKEFAEKFNKSKFSSDKIETTPEFEVGKWYQGKNQDCYGKLTSPIKDNCEFPSSEYISSNGVYCPHGNYFAGENWTKFAREVPLSEIQQFLPDGHPDKFINSTEMKILTNSFYWSPGIKKTKSDKEEIYFLPDPD